MYKVEGFLFESEEMAEIAKKEVQGVKYIKAQTKMDDPDVVLKLYKRLIEEKVFETPVGIHFLCELREYLTTIPYIKNEDVPEILVREKKMNRQQASKPGKAVKPQKTKTVVKTVRTNDGYKGLFHVCLFLVIVLSISIAGMFVIQEISYNNPTILNYENELIDRYEAWESELEERERALKEKEQ